MFAVCWVRLGFYVQKGGFVLPNSNVKNGVMADTTEKVCRPLAKLLSTANKRLAQSLVFEKRTAHSIMLIFICLLREYAVKSKNNAVLVFYYKNSSNKHYYCEAFTNPALKLECNFFSSFIFAGEEYQNKKGKHLFKN